MAPKSGEMTFRFETNRELIVNIGESNVPGSDPQKSISEYSVSMNKGEPKPAGLYSEDLPGSEKKTAPSAYLIDDVKIVSNTQ